MRGIESDEMPQNRVCRTKSAFGWFFLAELSYDELRRIYRLEKNTSRLVEVDESFFSDLKDFIKEQKAVYLKSLKNLSMSKAKDFSNLKRMVEEIFLIREKKLLNKALVSSRTGEIMDEKISSVEKKAFSEMLNVLQKHKRVLNEVFGIDELDFEKSAIDLNNISVRIIKDIPAFVGTDMKEYGPFSIGQNLSLPPKIANLLVSRKLVESD